MSGLQGLPPPYPRSLDEHHLDGLAVDVARRLFAFDNVTTAGLIAFGPGEFACFLALVGPDWPTAESGRPLRRAHARYLRGRARLGVWIERWFPESLAGTLGEQLPIEGLTAGAFIPLRTESSVPGLLLAATDSPDGAELLEGRLSGFAEFGTMVSRMLADALTWRSRSNWIRAEIGRIIERRAFRTVFQPIVRFEDSTIVAFEALTRFGDGVPPQRRFGEADSIGLGHELEIATLETAVEMVATMPGAFRLNVNVSPDVVVSGRDLQRIVGPHADRVTLELTEQQRVDDYRALRRAVSRLPSGVHWAIDDAGAGFASLRHIIELRPQEVKLDRAIVKRVDRDPIRQAVVAGLSHFASTAGCRLIAEGVETTSERDKLRELGIAFGQGFLFGEPGPPGELPADGKATTRQDAHGPGDATRAHQGRPRSG